MTPSKHLAGLVFIWMAVSVCRAQGPDPSVPPFELWTGGPVPSTADAPPVAGVEFYVVKRRKPELDGFNWLHGAAIARHRGVFYVSFGHNAGSENTASEVANGRRSIDGGTPASRIMSIRPPRAAGESRQRDGAGRGGWSRSGPAPGWPGR